MILTHLIQGPSCAGWNVSAGVGPHAPVPKVGTGAAPWVPPNNQAGTAPASTSSQDFTWRPLEFLGTNLGVSLIGRGGVWAEGVLEQG